MQNILQTDHLTKAIRKKELVSDVSLHIKKGEIYGFLGPNGAGKTTVMKMLTNLWKPSGGQRDYIRQKSFAGLLRSVKTDREHHRIPYIL